MSEPSSTIDFTKLNKAQEATLRRIRRLENQPLPPTRTEIYRDYIWLALALGLEIATKSVFVYLAYQNGASIPENARDPKDVFRNKVARGQGDIPSTHADVCLSFWLIVRIAEFVSRGWQDGINHIADTRDIPLPVAFLLVYGLIGSSYVRGDRDYLRPIWGSIVRSAMVWCHGLACSQYQRIQRSREHRGVTKQERDRIRLELAAERAASRREAEKAKHEEKEEVKVSGADMSTSETELRGRNQPKGRRRSHQYRAQLKEESEQSIPDEDVAGDN